MSHATADPHDDVDSGEHEAHAEPADELAPDEPTTPLWLTGLGGALFLLLAIVWLAVRSSDAADEQSAAAASASATASAAAAAPPPPPTVVPPPPPPPPPSPPPAAVAPAGARPAASTLPRFPRHKVVKP